jgi:CrcB protein
MNQVLLIAAGGAAGALARYWASKGTALLLGGEFPYGTLVVNVSGCLAMGFLYIYLVERGDFGAEWRAALLIGFLGAYTTFSSFSIETLNLVEAGHALPALMNVLLSLSLCLMSCWAGIIIGRAI